jgi:hypothetical protein
MFLAKRLAFSLTYLAKKTVFCSVTLLNHCKIVHMNDCAFSDSIVIRIKIIKAACLHFEKEVSGIRLLIVHSNIE